MITASITVPGIGYVTYEYEMIAAASGAKTPYIHSVKMNGQDVSERDFEDARQYITGQK